MPAGRKRGPERTLQRIVHAWLGTLLILGLSAGFVHAEDNRPAELPYLEPGEIPVLDLATLRSRERRVTISDHMLKPQILVLLETERVVWFSYSRAPARIRFEREVANDVICHGLVNFAIEEDELISGELRPLDQASFCVFKPGRYRYQVVVRNDPHSATRQRMDGILVVEPVKRREGGRVPSANQGVALAEYP